MLLVKEMMTRLIVCYIILKCCKKKLIQIELNKQQAPGIDSKAIQQINFIANLDRTEVAWMVFILMEVRETILDFLQVIIRVVYKMKYLDIFLLDISGLEGIRKFRSIWSLCGINCFKYLFNIYFGTKFLKN